MARVGKRLASVAVIAVLAALFASRHNSGGLALSSNGQRAELIGDYSLPDVRIATLQPVSVPLPITNDRCICLGGFSDLWRRPDDPPGEFWVVTDRGPNGIVSVEGKRRRTFPVPDYAPLLVRCQIDGPALAIRQVVPLVGRSGRPLTGLPNDVSADDPGYDFAGQRPVNFDPDGLDPEGMVRAADGAFWLAEEYRPSLVKVDARGQVLKRFVPEGATLTGADYDVIEALPPVYAHRQENRGFEGLAISPDSSTLYAAIQSPLANPSRAVAARSRNTRILAFDVATERRGAEYIYQFDVAPDFAASAKSDDMKIGAMTIVAPDRMLVLEHNDHLAKVYAIKLSTATNILDTALSAATGDDSLEALENPLAAGIRPLQKTLVADLSQILMLPDKIEGICLAGQQTLAIVNDNDFGFDGFDAVGNAIPSGVKTRLLEFRVPGLPADK